MYREFHPPEPCAWCGWVRGEHASVCPLHAFIRGDAATLAWPPGKNEPGPAYETQPPAAMPCESAVKLDCPE